TAKYQVLAIPDNVATYTTLAVSCDVDASSTYVGSPTLVPPSGAVLVVSTGTEITFNVDNVSLYKTVIEDGATLNVNYTDGHRLGIVEGTGNLRVTSDGTNASLPAADYGTFLSCSGGGLEYAGNGSYSVLSGITELRNLAFSGSGERRFPNSNVEICEDFVVDGPTVDILTNRRLIVYGNALLQSGVLNAPSGNSARFNVFGDNFTITGGTFNGSSSGRTNIFQNMILAGGSLNVGTSSYRYRIGGDFTFTSGSFDGGSSNSIIEFLVFTSFGFTEDTNLTGDFTGSNALGNVLIDKDGSGRSVNLFSDIEISGELDLTDGLVLSNGNDVTLGSSATVTPTIGRDDSYVAGKVVKTLSSSGSSFDFPIGNASVWRPASPAL
ncbi:MAG: hypothetical protein AAF223_21485, partial [Bacteroidota bacterium]